jgi:hypothetical protein
VQISDVVPGTQVALPVVRAFGPVLQEDGMSRLKSALLAATLIAAGAGGIAYAQMDSTFDPAQLPAVKGTVAQYLPTPRGDVDGLLLTDGTEIHVPPHLSTQLVFAVKPGDAVTVHGLRARAVKLVAAASVTNDASHVTIAWSEPPHMRMGAPMEAQGAVKAPLYGPRGEVNGVLLAEGTVVHLPPPEAQRLAEMLAVGKFLVVRGEGYAGPLGRALDARQIGPDAAHLVAVAGPRPPWGGGFWREHMRHRMMEPGMMGPPPGVDDAAPAPPPAE